MLLLLFILGIFFGFIFGKSKIIQFIQFLVSLITFSFATQLPDYIGYVLCYDSATVSNSSQGYLDAFEPGYRFSNYLFSNMGFDFDQFRMIIFLICYLLIMSTIKRYTSKPNIVFSLYMIFPFCMDCIQIRNFIGSAIIIFALRYILDRDQQLIKYIIGCCIASMFHSTMIIYLLYTIIYFDNKNFSKSYDFLFISICAICLCQYFIGISILNKIAYFTNRTSIFTYGAFFILLYLANYLSKYIHGFFARINIDTKFDSEYIARFIKLTCIFIPFLIFHFDFFRWVRNVMIVFSILVVNYLTYKNKLTERKLLISSIVIIAFVLLLYRHAFYGYEDSFWYLLFNNNKLFI